MNEHCPPNEPVITGKWLLQRLEHKLGEFCSPYSLDDLQGMYNRLLEAAIASDTSTIEMPVVCSIHNDIRYAIGVATWNQIYDSTHGSSFLTTHTTSSEDDSVNVEIPLELRQAIIQTLETLAPEDFPQEVLPQSRAERRAISLALRRDRCQQRRQGWRLR